MGKVITSTHMTVDGVIDAVETWVKFEGEQEDFNLQQLRAADALLLGRPLYEGFSIVWPSMTDETGFADRMNNIPKYVASRTLKDPLEWNSTLLKGDLAAEVTRLKHEHTGHLLVYGCGELATYLVRNDLVDEVRFFVNPIVRGSGVRPFHGEQVALRAIAATAYASGVNVLTYQPTPGR